MAQQGDDELPTAYLFLEDEGDIYRISVDRPRMIFGRDEDNDIVIRDERVAGHHAVLYYKGRQFTLSSLTEGSTRVNGKPVPGARNLFNGDVIDIAGNQIVFVREPRVSDTCLQIAVCEPGEEHWFALMNRPVIEIGHAIGDLLVPDDFVADPHCVIENFCAGVLHIVNLDERRGTLVNEVRIHGRRRLVDGDIISVGATDLVVRVHSKTALPGLGDLLPLQERQRARIATDDMTEDPARPKRTVRQILGDASEADHPDRFYTVMGDFEEDAQDRSYYLPEHRVAQAPSSLDAHLDEEAGAGHTMLIPLDSKGREKKVRWYGPDDGSGAGRRGEPVVEDHETMQDIPVASRPAARLPERDDP